MCALKRSHAIKRNSPRAAFYRRPIEVPASWNQYGGGIVVDCGVVEKHRARRPDEWADAFHLSPETDPATIQWPATLRHVGVLTSHIYDKTINLQLVQALLDCGIPEVRVIRVDGPARTCSSNHINLPESQVRNVV